MDEAALLRRVRDAAEARAGGRLVALYAIGSLAHGGFSPGASDVDVALVLEDPPEPGDALLARELGHALRDLPVPVSVFWETLDSLRAERYAGRFPACDRWDLRESGRLLAGTDVRHLVPRPPLRALLLCATDLALVMLSRPADVPGGVIDATALVLDPPRLMDRGARDASKVVLLPVRFLYTLRHGVVGRTDESVEDFLRGEGDTPRRRLVSSAMAWRSAGIADRDRSIAACRTALVPLYLEFIDRYAAAMRAHDEHDRADELARWRARLTA